VMQNFSRHIAGAGLALLAIVAAGSAVVAQGVVRAQYGDWQMSCDTPPGASLNNARSSRM
jgi:invasion protein IalB